MPILLKKIIFDGLFKDGDVVKISDINESFYEYMNSAKASLQSHLKTMGVFYPVSIKMQTTLISCCECIVHTLLL